MSEMYKREIPVLTEDDLTTYYFDFGRHKGKSLDAVMHGDPQYILWVCRETERFTIDEHLHRLVNEWIDFSENVADSFGPSALSEIMLEEDACSGWY